MPSTPTNPFILSEHAQDREAFSSPLFNQARYLADKYIESRQHGWQECAERIDSEIGAFLSESFGERDNKPLFHSLFLNLYTECNETFGSLNHGHCLWAYKTDYF